MRRALLAPVLLLLASRAAGAPSPDPVPPADAPDMTIPSEMPDRPPPIEIPDQPPPAEPPAPPTPPKLEKSRFLRRFEQPPLPTPPEGASRCSNGNIYAEPALFAASSPNGLTLFMRQSLGLTFGRCNADGTNGSGVNARFGLSGFLGGDYFGTVGLGAEAELNHPLSQGAGRLGLRFGWEAAAMDRTLMSFGLRYRTGDLSLALDGFHVSADLYNSSSDGVMAGVGAGGKTGRRIMAIEAAIVGGLFVLALLACAAGC